MVEEKETYQEYLKLCQKYNVAPDPIVTKIYTERLNLLSELYKMGGTTLAARLKGSPQ